MCAIFYVDIWRQCLYESIEAIQALVGVVVLVAVPVALARARRRRRRSAESDGEQVGASLIARC